MSTSTELVQLGSELWLKPGYGGISLVRRDAHGHILIGVFTDRLREYATDWSLADVMAALDLVRADTAVCERCGLIRKQVVR
ncbi:hypothetical protein [Mycolicibacterium canariasense]|uniref:hypothetical protein n=1 Tax=Mycolicibacterium canariasense TaxID=228230 RepID=UPI0032D5AAEB